MKASILRAGIETGVHRATLHRWIKSEKLKKDENGRVDTDAIVALRNAHTRGRRSGQAYLNPKAGEHPKTDVTLERGIKLITNVLRESRTEERVWVRRRIVERFADEKGTSELVDVHPMNTGKITPERVDQGQTVTAGKREEETPFLHADFTAHRKPGERGGLHATPSHAAGDSEQVPEEKAKWLVRMAKQKGLLLEPAEAKRFIKEEDHNLKRAVARVKKLCKPARKQK